MALLSCLECGQTVSSEAKFCPHCGIDDPTGEKERKKQVRNERMGEAAGAAAGVGCMGIGCAMQSVFLVLQLMFGLVVLGFIFRACSAVLG